MPESAPIQDNVTLTVGSAMNERVRHALHDTDIGLSPVPIGNPDYAAHTRSLEDQSRLRQSGRTTLPLSALHEE
jgi:hypothetical protein